MGTRTEDSKGMKELEKLHSMLRNIEEINDIQTVMEKGGEEPADDLITSKDVRLGYKEVGDNNNSEEQKDGKFLCSDVVFSESSLLDGNVDFKNFEDDIVLEEDDTWLLKSPSSSVRADKKPRSWLSNDIKTPELNRVKGSLASKVDLILIQSRKEKLSSLLAKHNLGSHPESAPGRLYQAESMCSVMSMDWEYDEEFRGGNQRQTASFTDSPARRKETDHQYFENNYFDDLQPMTLTFDASPTGQRSTEVTSSPMMRKANAMQGNGVKSRQRRVPNISGNDSHGRRPSYSDRSDSSGDIPSSPRGSLGSSRNSIESLDDAAFGKAKSGRRALLPISNFFHGAIPEEDLDFQFDTHSRILNPYAAWDLMRSHKGSSSQISDNASPVQVDPSLMVKLPVASAGGPVLRRRGATPKGNPISMSVDCLPRPRKSNESVSTGGREKTSSAAIIRSSMPRPRTALPSPRKSLLQMQKRLPPKSDLEQSPDVLPVNERNSNRRSQSPDLIARKSGIIRRGQGVSPSY